MNQCTACVLCSTGTSLYRLGYVLACLNSALACARPPGASASTWPPAGRGKLYSANSPGPSTAATLFRRLRIHLCIRKLGWTILQNCFPLASRALLLAEQALNTLVNHRMSENSIAEDKFSALVN